MFESLETRRFLNATLDGGTGLLTINGSAADDTINVGLLATDITVTIQPENFTQTFPASSVNGILILAGDGNDSVTILDAVVKNSEIQAGPGNDTVRGGGGNDDIRGEDGNDVLDGGLGADSMAGDGGFDVVTYATRVNPVNVTIDTTQDDGEAGENDVVGPTVDLVIGGSGADTLSSFGQTDPKFLYGLGGNDTLIAGGGGDRLNGGPGADSMTGGAGGDTFVGGADADVFIGGAGIDTVTYYYANTPVSVTLDGTATSGAAGEGDNVAADIENVVGSPFNDTIVGNATTSNFLKGLGGDDTVTSLGGGDTIWGGNGSDMILALNGAVDILDGGNGIDDIQGDPTDAITNET